MNLRDRASYLLIPKNGWVDIAILAGALLLCNSIFAREDLGWVRLNPSPYFILPILLGSRYGFATGVGAGLAAAGVVIGGLQFSHGTAVAKVLQEHGYLLGSFPFIGGICGEIQYTFRKKQLQLTTLLEHAQQRLKALDGDIYLLREAKAELERLLVTRDSELSTLDAELRRLFDSEGDELFQNILLLLNRQSRVSDAGIYLLTKQGDLERSGVLGPGQHLPERMPVDQIEMANLAIKHKTPVSIPDFWRREEGVSRNYLLATPFLDSKDNPLGVLIVTGMPFINLNKKTIHLIGLICRWAARIIEIRGQARESYRIVDGALNQKIFTLDFFRDSVALACQSSLLHSLPSSVALFTCPSQPESFQPDLEKLILAFLRGGDFPARLDSKTPNLAVLLPLTGERGAHIFLERIQFNIGKRRPELALQAKLFTFESKQTAEEFWNDLTAHAQKASATT